MTLIKCKECGGEVSTKAKACPKCGAKAACVKLWLWIPLSLVVGLFVFGAITGPSNTTELAQMEIKSCLRNQGGGSWRASSGVSLETYCATHGNMIGIKRACELNPSRC